jgi:polysaccharide chain length determinant protein (PEP-CTERM system associated)
MDTNFMVPQKSSAIAPPLGRLSILRMLWKSKTLIGLVWISVSVITAMVVQRIPAIYTSTALVKVDSQKIPDRYVSSTIVSDAQDRLATLSLEILSNRRLEQMIERFDLYREERRIYPMEKILDSMRTKDITVRPETAWNGRTASFRVGYQGPDPLVVARVANWIANIYVEENTKTRETQAVGTSQFMDSQLKEAKEKLDRLEEAVRLYKTRHNGELPQQEASLNGTLNRLQVELEANRDALNRAQQTRMTLQDSLRLAEDSARIEERELRLAAATPTPGAIVPAGSLQRPLTRAEQLQAQLADFRLRGYTDENPDVKRIRRQLDQIRQAQKELPLTDAEAGGQTGTVAAGGTGHIADSPELRQTRAHIANLKSQLSIAEQELKTREADQRRILSSIAVYQARINGLPIREQEMAQITRDYEFSKVNYQALLDKKINANMAADMEVRQKSEQFTIADQALVPTKPAKPNRVLLNTAGIVFGLLLGAVLGFGKEMQRATLLGEWELPPGVPVLGRLPHIHIAPNSVFAEDDSASRIGGRKQITPHLANGILWMLAAGAYLIKFGTLHVSRILWIN